MFHFDVWFRYLSLLFFRVGPEADALLKETTSFEPPTAHSLAFGAQRL